MSSTASVPRLLIGGGLLLTAALATGTLFGGIPAALADQDPAANPAGCSAADLAEVRSGVEAATADYLFSHPDFNGFMTSLAGLSRQKVGAKVADYMAAHPDTKAEITGIRQPLVDLRDRCGAPPGPAN